MTSELSSVRDLVGEEISGICFVRDYVEIHFDGPILRSLARPSVTVGQEMSTFPEEGSRDQLCRLIGHTVIRIEITEGHSIELWASSGASLRIPLDGTNSSWPEAAHFVPAPNAPFEIW